MVTDKPEQFCYSKQERKVLFVKNTSYAILKIMSLVLPAVLLAGCAAPAKEATYRQIPMEEAVRMMEEETDYIILDVRTPEEFAEKHIPGAVNVPNETIGTDPSHGWAEV